AVHSEIIGQGGRPKITLHQTNGTGDTLRKQLRHNRAEPTASATNVNWGKQNRFRSDLFGSKKQALHQLQRFFANAWIQRNQIFRTSRSNILCRGTLSLCRRRPGRAEANTSQLQQFIVLAHGFSPCGVGSKGTCSSLGAARAFWCRCSSANDLTVRECFDR